MNKVSLTKSATRSGQRSAIDDARKAILGYIPEKEGYEVCAYQVMKSFCDCQTHGWRFLVDRD